MRVMLSALVLVAALGAGGCKQGDGALPAKINDVPNRLGDLQRDLAAVVGGEQQAVQDLTDGLLDAGQAFGERRDAGQDRQPAVDVGGGARVERASGRCAQGRHAEYAAGGGGDTAGRESRGRPCRGRAEPSDAANASLVRTLLITRSG